MNESVLRIWTLRAFGYHGQQLLIDVASAGELFHRLIEMLVF